MSIIENMLYGLVSGMTEFLPISSKVHQSLLRYLFGVESRLAVQDLIVHIAILLSVLVAGRESILRLYHEHQNASSRHRTKSRVANNVSYYDLRLVKTAAIPLVWGSLFYVFTIRFERNLLALIGFVILNAVVLLVAEHSRHGNRDARKMTGLDAVAMGILGSASSLPGISRTAMISSYATVRGAQGRSVAEWVILLSVPALIFSICFDIFAITAGGVGSLSFMAMIGYILAGCTAFGGGYIGVSILKLMLPNSGLIKFAYYCFGIAMLIFLLYLFT